MHPLGIFVNSFEAVAATAVSAATAVVATAVAATVATHISLLGVMHPPFSRSNIFLAGHVHIF